MRELVTNYIADIDTPTDNLFHKYYLLSLMDGRQLLFSPFRSLLDIHRLVGTRDHLENVPSLSIISNVAHTPPQISTYIYKYKQSKYSAWVNKRRVFALHVLQIPSSVSPTVYDQDYSVYQQYTISTVVQTYSRPVDIQKSIDYRRAYDCIFFTVSAKPGFRNDQRDDKNKPKPGKGKTEQKTDKKKPKPDPGREGTREPREPREPNTKPKGKRNSLI